MTEEKEVKYFEYFGDRLRMLLPFYTLKPIESSPYIKDWANNVTIQAMCETIIKYHPDKMMKINETYLMIIWVEPKLISIGCIQ